jgi:hypothetical protein
VKKIIGFWKNKTVRFIATFVTIIALAAIFSFAVFPLFTGVSPPAIYNAGSQTEQNAVAITGTTNILPAAFTITDIAGFNVDLGASNTGQTWLREYLVGSSGGATTPMNYATDLSSLPKPYITLNGAETNVQMLSRDTGTTKNQQVTPATISPPVAVSLIAAALILLSAVIIFTTRRWLSTVQWHPLKFLTGKYDSLVAKLSSAVDLVTAKFHFGRHSEDAPTTNSVSSRSVIDAVAFSRAPLCAGLAPGI